MTNRSYDLEDQLEVSKNRERMSTQLQDLWQDHIRDITSEVRQLNREVDGLKQQLAVRDQFEQETSQQSKSVEQLTKAGVSDLRGRVVRCDTSIAQLASEVRAINSKSSSDSDRLHQITETSIEKARQLEDNMALMSRRMEKLLNDQENRIEKIEGNSNIQLETIDLRVKAILDDIRLTVEGNRKWNEAERSRIEQQLISLVDLNNVNIQSKQESFELKITERMEKLERLMRESKDDIGMLRKEIEKNNKNDEIFARMETMRRKMELDVRNLKKEYREGFESVRESINATNRLTDTKLKLFKENITRDIRTTIVNNL